MGIMGLDTNEVCKLCGAPVCLYYINFEEGLKMCSNEECTHLFSEEQLKFFNVEEFQASSSHSAFDTTSVIPGEIPRLNCKADQVSECSVSVISNLDVSSKAVNDVDNLLDLEQIEANKNVFAKPAPVEDEKLIQALKRVQDVKYVRKNRTVISNPRMLRHLETVTRLTQPRTQAHALPTPRPSAHDLEPNSPQYQVNVDTNSAGGPIIRIDLTTVPQVHPARTNDGASTSNQVSL